MRRRPILSGLVCGLVLASGLTTGGAASAASPAPGVPDPSAYYPLATNLVDSVGARNGTAVGAVTYGDGLTLSGGSASGPYASLPSSVVTDQGEDLTISTWVRREVPNGNYAALFFGTAAAPDVPANYWLLNPSNPAGFAKSVFTNGTAATQPWTTEVGPSSATNSVSASGLRSQWAQYTTVITADSIRGYLNGVPVGPAVPKTKLIGGFAGPISVLIGKSGYRTDATYAGSFRDLRIFDEPLAAEQVAALYTSDLSAPTVAPSGVSATVAEDSVTVGWSAAPASSGRTAVTGYRVTLTPTGGSGAPVSTDLPPTARSHTARGLVEGSYAVSVSAINAAGSGPVAASGATVTTGAPRSDAQWVARARAALLAAPAFSGTAKDRISGSLELADTLADLQVAAGGSAGSAEFGSDTVSIDWTSSDDSVITDTDTARVTTTDGVADVVAKGAVHRGAADTAATLTATIRRGDATDTVVLPVTVLAAPGPESADYEAYLFAYFSGNTTDQQQIRFATTNGDDALDWTELNDAQPVLTSSKGTGGLRDPSIVRSVEGDRFFLLATDLDITRTTWPESFTNGSRHLEIWESTDLVNWSEQRHVEVSEEWAGMTWAPEAHWDESIGEYVVFWSSRVYPEGQPHVTDAPGTATSRIVYSTTRDFRSFSEPRIWVDSGDRIDATVIKKGDEYLRFTKEVSGRAGCQDIVAESSTSLRSTYLQYPSDGAWSVVENCVARNAGYTPIVEGPTVFAANEGDVNGPGYYLFADWFNGTGYQAFFTDDPTEPGWTYLDPAKDDRVSLPASPRHGSVINITRAERDALLGAYREDLLVTEVAPVAVDTTIGSPAPVLPSTVTATYGRDGGRTESVAVTWDSFDASKLDVAGETLTVSGTLVNGAATRATAVLTAVAPVVPGPVVSATASARCVAGRIVLTVTATNRDSVPVAFTIESIAGTKSFAAVAPGRNAAAAFTTRVVSVPAGTATVRAISAAGSVVLAVATPPASCS